MGLDKWTTLPAPTQAKAFIGVPGISHTFRFNPDQVSWDYQENTFSQDTLGGRVVQLLSVGLNGITIQGRAGSRGELQKLAKNIKQIMNYQVKTLNAVDFKVPSRNWNFKVYIQAMPQVSWDVASTSYPYQLNLLVEEDLSGVKTKEINSEVLKRLASGVGHDASKEIHGGDAAAYAEIVDLIVAGWASLSTATAGAVADIGSGATGDIIAIAQTQVGVGYSQDDRIDPAGEPDPGLPGPHFDCSGFTWWCYKEAGIRVPSYPWTTATIPNAPGIAKLANPSEARPGMMILWSGHVALYIDGGIPGGNMIDSHNPSDPIRASRPISEFGSEPIRGIYYAEGYQYP